VVARLALKVVALHFDVPQLELEGPLAVAQRGDLFLKRVLRVVGLGLALLVLGLSSLRKLGSQSVMRHDSCLCRQM
jgi:hypothetical protein